LGFSGNAKLDFEIAEVIADVDASLYILDFLPNATVDEMNEKAEHFYSIIRNRRPDTPILFVEDPVFTHSRYDSRMANEIKTKNATIHRIVDTWKARGDNQIELLSSVEMIGDDGEATIDGIHFTDLGFMRYADLLYPVIKKKYH
jgi:lysophospholipase L1-like esterase